MGFRIMLRLCSATVRNDNLVQWRAKNQESRTKTQEGSFLNLMFEFELFKWIPCQARNDGSATARNDISPERMRFRNRCGMQKPPETRRPPVVMFALYGTGARWYLGGCYGQFTAPSWLMVQPLSLVKFVMANVTAIPLQYSRPVAPRLMLSGIRSSSALLPQPIKVAA